MSSNVSWDSFELPTLDVPYNRVEGELQDDPRFVRGQNTFITWGGKVDRRPGTVPLNANNTLNLRVDNGWVLETLDNPIPKVYIVVSAWNPATGYWEIWHQEQTATPTPFVQSGTYRDLNLSTQPHVACVERGLLFIKGFPSTSSTEKLGTVIFSGLGGTVTITPWGILGPQQPVFLNLTTLGILTTPGGILATDTSMTVNEPAQLQDFPAAPFVIQVDYEQIQVGSVTGPSTALVLGSLDRAFNGTVASTHSQGATILYRNWPVSAHAVLVQLGWTYAYAYKDSNGQYSNLCPPTINPDELPSNTGPFFNQIPSILVAGNADTVNIPSIGIFRTTDGGGTFYFLGDITNTGTGLISYVDDTLASASGNMDPIPDTLINTFTVGPSLTSNSPPPTVLSPLVTGVATPALSSPIASYQARLWFGIGNVLFFSGNEEVTLGVPEECWPSGLNGNFFRFQYQITNLAATQNNLYVFTTNATYIITGTNLQTFAAAPVMNNIGFPLAMQRAIDVFSTTVVFLSHDYRIIMLSDGGSPVIMSDPLYTDIVDQINAGAVFDIKYFADLDKELIFVTGHIPTAPNESLQWVYDVKKSLKLSMTNGIYMPLKHLWNLPWTYPSTAQISGRISEATTQRRMVFFSWDPVGLTGLFARVDPTLQTTTDCTVVGPTETFDIDMVFCLQRVPPGDHVNQRRLPKVTPVVYSISFERTAFSGDDDPSFYWFADDLWTDPISVNVSENPARRPQSKGYTTMEFPIFNVAQRIAWELTKVASADRFELQNFIVTFSPDTGA